MAKKILFCIALLYMAIQLNGCSAITDNDNGIGIVEIGESGAMNPFMPATIEGGCFIFGHIPKEAVIDFNNGKCTVTMEQKGE